MVLRARYPRERERIILVSTKKGFLVCVTPCLVPISSHSNLFFYRVPNVRAEHIERKKQTASSLLKVSFQGAVGLHQELQYILRQIVKLQGDKPKGLGFNEVVDRGSKDK